MKNDHYVWLHAGKVSDAKVDARLRLDAIIDRTPVPCRLDPEHWYSDSRYATSDAAKRCRGCPAFAACDAYADVEPVEQWGVWGGRNRNHRSKT
jgi:hypothetical protein